METGVIGIFVPDMQTYTMYLNIAKLVGYVSLLNAINNINENNRRIYEFKRSGEIA